MIKTKTQSLIALEILREQILDLRHKRQCLKADIMVIDKQILNLERDEMAMGGD